MVAMHSSTSAKSITTSAKNIQAQADSMVAMHSSTDAPRSMAAISLSYTGLDI